MAVSQNGYSANDRSVVQSYAIGDKTHVTLRKGSAGAMLVHFADWFDRYVQDIDAGQLDDWGYAERPIRGGTELSNHASGTAVDLNATKWALGSRASRNLTALQIAAVHKQLLIYSGCIRWGEDYSGRTDPMHFEINKDQGEVDRVWAVLSLDKVNTAPAPSPYLSTQPVIKQGAKGEAVRILQRTLNVNYPAYSKLTVDGDFGPATTKVVREFQTRAHLTVDGVVGPATWKALGL